MGTLMKGIEVLSQAEVPTDKAINSFVFWIIVAAFFIGTFVYCYVEIGPDRPSEWIGIIVIAITGAVMGSIFGFIIGMATGTPTDYETRYKVTISDEVQMNDFFEKYEIVSQDGKIYEIKEKEND